MGVMQAIDLTYLFVVSPNNVGVCTQSMKNFPDLEIVIKMPIPRRLYRLEQKI